MKHKTLVVAISLLLVFLPLVTASAMPAAPQEFSPVQKGFAATGQNVFPYAPDRILVKFTENSLQGSKLNIGLRMGAAASGIETGILSVDALNREIGVIKISRPFIEPANRTEAARLGVHLWYMFELSGGADIEEAARRYEADPNIEHATPDWLAFPMVVPSDPMYAAHWGHNNTAQLPGYDWGGTWDHTGPPVGTVGFDANAQAAWDGTQGFGSASIIVAIIDSGVDIDHPDLSLVTGYDYGDNDSNPDDNSSAAGHGTCCAGVAAAKVNNALGACGAAPACKVMPLKVANSAGSMYFSAIVNAIYYAADHGAHVISMSLGAAITSDPSTDAAILYAYNAGVTILAATGNENKSTVSYPAINSYVIGVGAASPCGDRKRSSSLSTELNPGVYADPNGYTCDGERWWGSNYGSTTKDAAGAVDILGPTIVPTTDIGGSGGYQPGDYEPFFNGTSCATPYVAGVCALVKSKNPTWTPSQIRAQITSTAIDIINVEAVAGWDRFSGYGMVDAAAAVGGGGPVAPVAAFTGSPTSGAAPLVVNFTDQSSGTPTSWSWTFGDGGTSTAQNPAHTYAAAGTFTVSLTATNAVGSDVETKTGYITATVPSTWTTITYDAFESGFGTYTDGGADCARYTGGTYAWEGSAAIDIQDNSGTASSFYHTASYNVTAYNTLEVDFYFIAVSMEVGEDFFVQYYSGSAWYTVGTYKRGTNFNNATWYHATVRIARSQYNFPTNAKIRIMCDASNDIDDVYIDAVTFRGTASVNPTSASLVVSERADDTLPAELAGDGPEAAGTELFQNFPNPFNPTTSISFRLAEASNVRLEVFNVAGQRVATLIDEHRGAGPHSVDFNATALSSGIYFYRLTADDVTQFRKMILLK